MMTTVQKRIFSLLVLLGLVYFLAFIPANLLGAKSETMLARTSIDEPVLYGPLVRMLTPAKDWTDLFARWVLYGEYHYGYPYYFLSAIVVLPVRLAAGKLFTNYTWINLLLLRQMISVLPMIVAAGFMVYLQTRFKSWVTAVGLFFFILSTRGIVRQNIQWWHPDALAILAVVLTLFFLERDRLRFGRNFYFAAAACGLATGIKLAGVWFFLTIAMVLLLGLRNHTLTFKRMILAGVLFVIVMAALMVLSNPFLYNAGARQEMVAIQSYKTVELDKGYEHDDPQYYTKGPQWWRWTLNDWYGHPLFLGFLFLSLIVGSIWGPNRLLNGLLLTWVIPFSIFLLYFVAVKPDHYWLPVMVPLFSAALNIPLAVRERVLPWFISRPAASKLLITSVVLLLAGQLFWNIARPSNGVAILYDRAMDVEQQ
jgi:hypothetical protein